MELYSVNLRMGLYARIVVVGQFAGDKVCERERERERRGNSILLRMWDV